jgi:hypothetical protein
VADAFLFETTGPLSRADLPWVYHARYGFNGKGVRIERPPLIIDLIPTLVYNGERAVNEHSRTTDETKVQLSVPGGVAFQRSSPDHSPN